MEDKYGMTVLDIKNCQFKIDKQKSYLKDNTFQTANGEFKSYLDISMSANISSRYYAQLVNKVNTLQQIMTTENLIPIFITITLTGVLHDLIYGDYRRFDEDKHIDLLPETDQHGYLKTKAINRETFTAAELYQVIRWNWYRFQSTYQYMKMKKEGHKVGYLFNTEPHQSGVPHSHVLLYIPEEYKYKILEEFKKIFTAPRNIGQDKKRLTKEQITNGELNGFQWSISNPVGYVMKYCTKSFIDLQNQSKLDELQAWYIKHRIIRISMSHTLVPQWVYQKIYPLESDWLYLSELRINSECEWSKKNDYFEFKDDNKKQILRYDNGLYQQFIDGKLVREFGEKRKIINPFVLIDGIEFSSMILKNGLITDKETYKIFRIRNFKNRYPFGKPILKSKLKKPKQEKDIIPVAIENDINKYYLEDGTLKKVIVIPSYMKSLELINYYYKLEKNLNTMDELYLPHFGVVQNECIRRGLIDDVEIQSLNDFNCKFELGA